MRSGAKRVNPDCKTRMSAARRISSRGRPLRSRQRGRTLGISSRRTHCNSWLTKTTASRSGCAPMVGSIQSSPATRTRPRAPPAQRPPTAARGRCAACSLRTDPESFLAVEVEENVKRAGATPRQLTPRALQRRHEARSEQAVEHALHAQQRAAKLRRQMRRQWRARVDAKELLGLVDAAPAYTHRPRAGANQHAVVYGAFPTRACHEGARRCVRAADGTSVGRWRYASEQETRHLATPSSVHKPTHLRRERRLKSLPWPRAPRREQLSSCECGTRRGVNEGCDPLKRGR